MDKEEILKQAGRILTRFSGDTLGAIPEAAEFLRVYAGERSIFYKNIVKLNPEDYPNHRIVAIARGALAGFVEYVQNDLYEGVSLERKVQIDTVSDLLDQANALLNAAGVHPAAPAVIIGAGLEEFLRNWVEEIGELPGGNPSIDTYSKLLRKAELIDKQDSKDITAWAGLRNNAAHGKWDEVNDKKRIALMLEGVNLFMRKHTK